jgi:hypothetical protein
MFLTLFQYFQPKIKNANPKTTQNRNHYFDAFALDSFSAMLFFVYFKSIVLALFIKQ